MKLSIITINKNNASGLLKTLESIRDQLTEQMELLVIDGVSVDNSLDIIYTYQKYITAYISEPDKGIYDAMNKGVKMAQGEYVYFLNAGDTWNKDLNLYDILLNSEDSDFIFGSCILIYSDILSYTDYLPIRMKKYDFYDGVCHQSMIIKRKLFLRGGYRTDLLVSDWYFMIESILVHSKTFTTLPFVFCIYDFRGVSSSSEGQERIKTEKQELWKAHRLGWNHWEYITYCLSPRILKKKLFVRLIRILS